MMGADWNSACECKSRTKRWAGDGEGRPESFSPSPSEYVCAFVYGQVGLGQMWREYKSGSFCTFCCKKKKKGLKEKESNGISKKEMRGASTALIILQSSPLFHTLKRKHLSYCSYFTAYQSPCKLPCRSLLKITLCMYNHACCWGSTSLHAVGAARNPPLQCMYLHGETLCIQNIEITLQQNSYYQPTICRKLLTPCLPSYTVCSLCITHSDYSSWFTFFFDESSEYFLLLNLPCIISTRAQTVNKRWM